MYHTYNTKAIVINKQVKDNDAVLLLLTQELGLIFAQAKGAKRPAAKLKHLIEPGDYFTASLIKGKNKWILKGVWNHKKILSNFKQGASLRLVSALVGMQEPDEKLFNALYLALQEKNIFQSLHRLIYVLGYSNINSQDFASFSLSKQKQVIDKFLSQTLPQNDILR